ncbi:MAG: hypothetical protein ACRDV2_17580, partial [Actinomycetes bacterium]
MTAPATTPYRMLRHTDSDAVRATRAASPAIGVAATTSAAPATSQQAPGALAAARHQRTGASSRPPVRW